MYTFIHLLPLLIFFFLVIHPVVIVHVAHLYFPSLTLSLWMKTPLTKKALKYVLFFSLTTTRKAPRSRIRRRSFSEDAAAERDGERKNNSCRISRTSNSAVLDTGLIRRSPRPMATFPTTLDALGVGKVSSGKGTGKDRIRAVTSATPIKLFCVPPKTLLLFFFVIVSRLRLAAVI